MMRFNLLPVQKSLIQHPAGLPSNQSWMSDDARVRTAVILIMLAAGIIVIITVGICSAYYVPGTMLNS